MKITRKELDASILAKLDQLDTVKTTFDENSSDGFVSYGPNGFYFKKTNDTFLKKVFTEDEIVDLEESLHSRKRNIKSSIMQDFRLDTKYNAATRKFLYKVPFISSKEFSGRILLKEKISSGVLLLLSDGNLVKAKGENIESINILEMLKTTFNLSAQFSVYSFVGMAEIDINTFVIATSNFGIYKVSFTDKSAELICILNLVKDVEVTHTGSIFVATDEFCAQYDIATGKRIEKYCNLLNERQIPKRIIKSENGIFVYGIPAGIQNNDNLLHFWRLDRANVGYNCCDDMIKVHSFDNAYQILGDWVDENYLYLSGKLGNHKLFIWKYDLNTLDMEEIIIDCVDITTFDGFIAINNHFVFLCKDRLHVITDNVVIGRFVLPEECDALYTFKGEFYTTYKHSFGCFKLPVFENKTDSLSYLVYEGADSCNNIDMIVCGATRSERITLIDMNTNREILPSYYLVYNNNSVIKLMNCKATKIKMVISVNEKSILDGIVVKNNRMFLR